jgi:hypothetical protein
LEQRQLLDIFRRNVLCFDFDERTFSCFFTFDMIESRANGGRYDIILKMGTTQEISLSRADVEQYGAFFRPVARIVWHGIHYFIEGNQFCEDNIWGVEREVAHVSPGGSRVFVPAELMPAWRSMNSINNGRSPSDTSRVVCSHFARDNRSPSTIVRVFPRSRQVFRLIERRSASRLRIRHPNGQPY